jgi:hypothetical protein
MAQLMLKRASASRTSGQWRDDDYDVLGALEIAAVTWLEPGIAL